MNKLSGGNGVKAQHSNSVSLAILNNGKAYDKQRTLTLASMNGEVRANQESTLM